MRWADVIFAHWAVEPAVVDEQLPAGLTVDTYDGDAYLGVVGFRMENIRPRGSPAGLSFHELNLRTYVDGPIGPGIYFFNLDADDLISVAVARSLFRLPYYRADMRVSEEGDAVRFRSRRTHPGVPFAGFDATYSPSGPVSEPEPGSLAAFLTERYRFYVVTGGRVWAGPVEHRSWPLQASDIEIDANDLFGANGFADPDGEPLVHYSPGVDVTAEMIRTVGERAASP